MGFGMCFEEMALVYFNGESQGCECEDGGECDLHDEWAYGDIGQIGREKGLGENGMSVVR